ncbi:hypothetical protein LAC81_28960 [Ensifer adhaerens]|uniref:hypothetical protein n=1 Tax=Ensifer adhaerens TaxID=106592 RepID=UPI001CC16B55|nr:hypothetical protein [Ensifer adhaerens]MBZ7924771.1 hypothetical protein [Ensifer adhaerens]UAX96006.1 hypothetical protein LAC78_34870 [Ensifer adhaerens]UAY04653.1 hypothetical protein LAC80_25440 [Ensifer adhaerens]UAY10084.1 hypothetical protein LAC81_28960 [Ensifer adhaerens]
MHTLIIVACGFVLLALLVAFGWLWHIGQFPNAQIVRLFISIWLVISIVNMWIGISKAGYPFKEELVILPQVFLPPAIAAGCLLMLS